MVEEFNLHTVIRLPGSCFAPYTGITTNLLFFEKTEPTTDVWFYRFDLPNGQNFSMTKNPMTREKMGALDEWWNNRIEIMDKKKENSQTETWKAKKVSVKDIVKNDYNLNYCDFPNEEKIILSPKDTIGNFQDKQEEIEKKMKSKLAELIDMLGV